METVANLFASRFNMHLSRYAVVLFKSTESTCITQKKFVLFPLETVNPISLLNNVSFRHFVNRACMRFLQSVALAMSMRERNVNCW